MSLLKSLRGKSFDFDPSTYREGFPMYFWDDKGHEHAFRYNGHSDALKAYQCCPPLTSIINRKAQAYINGKTFVMNTRGKEATSEEAKKIKALIKKPNPLQNQKQFEAQQEIYIQLFGYCLLLPIIPAGYEKYGAIEATSMWNIPPNMLTIEETNKIFYQTTQEGILKKIQLNYRNQQTDLPVKNIRIFKDISPCFDTLLFPASRVKSLEIAINNIIGALESRNVLINYRGANGIFSLDPGSGAYGGMPLSEDEKKYLQKEFHRYGLLKKQWQYIITSASLKWQQIGTQVKDLGLFEEVIEDSKMICDAYGYPPHLLGLIDPTFNNQNAAEKGLYNNTIIPEADSNYDEWNSLFNTSELNLNIIKDYSHLPVLQDDAAQQATAELTKTEALKIQYEMGLITLNDCLVELGKDPIGELGNVRSSDVKNANVPLVTIIGVGGVQGLVTILTAQGIDPAARQATLEIVFGVSAADAQRMSQSSNTQTNGNTNTPGQPGTT